LQFFEYDLQLRELEEENEKRQDEADNVQQLSIPLSGQRKALYDNHKLLPGPIQKLRKELVGL
jgi:hypothetical protein